MKELRHISSQAELERLIERYFDGETSLQEENAMRQALAHCQWSSETIDEAKFAMGYFAAHADRQRRGGKSNQRRIIGIAATIAIILTAGGFALWHQQASTTDVCIAYVNGKAINNDEAVMALVEKDLDNINHASQGMTAQLSSLGEAIELDNE